MCCISVCVIPVMGIGPWLRVTAGLVCCPSKRISMGKQTRDAVSHLTDTLKLLRQGVLSSKADLGVLASMIESQHLFGWLEVVAVTEQTGRGELCGCPDSERAVETSERRVWGGAD